MQDYLGINKYQLDTPALVIDKDKLIDNIMRMQQFADNNNINLRPHAKTHKCSTIAKLQIEYGCCGICVAKVSESYELAKTGISGILITSPIVTAVKVDTLIKVLQLAPDTMLVIDNLDNANYLNHRLSLVNMRLKVLLDLDSGQLRTGVLMSSDVMAMARQLNSFSNLDFIGIQCYAGHIQHIKNLQERTLDSENILNQVALIRQQLLNEGINCRIQTGSGTGSFAIDTNISGVTEIQPGSYTVMDQEYFDIQVKDLDFLPAMTMLTTVISANHLSHVTVDAGTKAMYVVDTKPRVIKPANLAYDWVFGDEHGKVTTSNEGQLPKLGEVLELIVGHCDPTINLFDYFYITRNDIVIDRWQINLRGKCQ